MNARRARFVASLVLLAFAASSSASASFQGAQSKDAAGPGERAVARPPSGASQSKTRHDLDSQRAPQAGGNASRASAPNASAPNTSAPNASTRAADAPTSADAAAQPLVPHYAGTLAQGLTEMEHLADAEKYDDALRIGDELLAPTSFLRWKARVTAEGGWKEKLASAADPLLDGLGWNGAEPPQRAAVHYAEGIVQSRAGRRAAAEKAFESARSLSGPGDLRLDAIYDLGTLYLVEGEARRAEIPEISGQPAAGGAGGPGAAPIVPPGIPGGIPGGTPSGVPGAGGAGPKPPDPLDLATSAYLRAREHYVERLRSDWRDADARANTELVMRRLKELEEIRKKREEQKKQQEQQNQNDKDQQKKDQDKKDSKDKQDPKDDSQNKDKSQDKKDGDKDQPKPDEQKPEDKKPDEKKPDAKNEEKKSEDKPDEKPADQQAQPGEQKETLLTKEEVMRLLDRLKDLEEKAREMQMQLRHSRRAKVKKDW